MGPFPSCVTINNDGTVKTGFGDQAEPLSEEVLSIVKSDVKKLRELNSIVELEYYPDEMAESKCLEDTTLKDGTGLPKLKDLQFELPPKGKKDFIVFAKRQECKLYILNHPSALALRKLISEIEAKYQNED